MINATATLLNLTDLTPSQQKIITLLREKGDMLVTKIAEDLGIKRNSVYHHTKSLVEKNILRYQWKTKGRGRPITIVHLTS